MIEITYEPSRYELTMKGHAGYAEKGKDVVCASASMLCHALAQGLKEMRLGLVNAPHINLTDGYAKITCMPKKEFLQNIDLIYWTVLNGFNLLAQSYPEYVTFKVLEDEQ